MNPLQEYYLRNNVRVPYVFYGSSQVILHNPHRVKPCDKYRLLDVRAINKEGHDGVNIGKFDLSLAIPIRSSSSFFNKDDEWTVYWTEYHQHIVKKVSEWMASDWRLVGSSEELKMACWEVLCYSQDPRFGELPIPLLDLNFRTLDCNVPFDTRLNLIDKIVEYMAYYSDNNYNYKMIISAWTELSNLVNSPKYAHWLVRLAKG